MNFLASFFAISIGVIFIAAFLQPIFAKRFRKKPEVLKGKVVKSKIKQGITNKAEPSMTHYSYDIEYQYEYEGKVHTSSNIHKYLGFNTSEKSFITSLIAKYPIGKTIEVFVDSDGDSYLEWKPQTSPALVFFLGLISLIFGIALFIGSQ